MANLELRQSIPKIWIASLGSAQNRSTRATDQQCDCDCACPDGEATGLRVASAKGIDPKTRYRSSNPIFHVVLGDKVALMSAGSGLIVLDQAAAAILDLFRTPQSADAAARVLQRYEDDLILRIITIFVAAQLLVPADQAIPDCCHSEPPTSLTAWLHVTSSCPLRCAYCYVTAKSNRNARHEDKLHMTVATARRAVATVFRAAEAHAMTSVKLKYAGGEPTLNLPAVIAAQSYAVQLAKTRNVRVKSVLLTSGVGLTRANIRQLRDLDIAVSLSMDGLEEVHDRQRPRADGGNSFSAVLETLQNLADCRLSPHVSITLSRHNLASLDKTVEFLLARNLTFSFNFYRRIDQSYGPDPMQPATSELINGILQAFDVVRQILPTQSLLSNLVDRASFGVPHSYPCGVGRNYLVIDPSGTISKCQMAMDSPISHIDSLDPLGDVTTDRSGIQNLPVEQRSECADCAWRTYCAGGCPLAAYRTYGRYDSRSPYCEVYKAIFPASLRLEATRMLRYEQPYDFGVATRERSRVV